MIVSAALSPTYLALQRNGWALRVDDEWTKMQRLIVNKAHATLIAHIFDFPLAPPHSGGQELQLLSFPVFSVPARPLRWMRMSAGLT